jgi:hypothetical protein
MITGSRPGRSFPPVTGINGCVGHLIWTAPEGRQVYASNRAISQVSPGARQSKRTLPPSWPPIMFSTMRVPHPRCVGGAMVGPPDSVQRKLSCPPAVRDHAISTSPSAADSDPYFAALVASSCNGRPVVAEKCRPVCSSSAQRSGDD